MNKTDENGQTNVQVYEAKTSQDKNEQENSPIALVK